MENITIDVKKLERQSKIRRFKNKVKEKVQKTVIWIEDNKEFLAIVIPASATILAGGFKLIRSISRNFAIKQETRAKEMMIYDRSLGKYLELKRPLNNSDMKIILERKENGEKLSAILVDLNLLK